MIGLFRIRDIYGSPNSEVVIVTIVDVWEQKAQLRTVLFLCF